LLKDLKDDINIVDQSEKVSHESWMSYFSNLFSIKKQFENQNKLFTDLLKEVGKQGTFSELDFRITEKEISQAILTLKNNKSAGLDGIRNEMLKCGQSSLLPCLVKLFNLILTNGQYPKEWKKSYIKPLFKSDDPSGPSNYRGISVMSCLAKLFNCVLNTRLQKFLDVHKIINNTQIGFQPKARTSDHMFFFKNHNGKIYRKWK